MELVLSIHEQESPLGQKLRTYFSARLQAYREQNDKPMDPEDRAYLLAKIAQAKLMVTALTREPLKAVAP